MANSSLSLVNQKLAYARALIKQASPLSNSTTTSERLQLRALLDASVFHLMCGIHHYLREIAENYRVKNVGTSGGKPKRQVRLAIEDARKWLWSY